MKRGKLAPVVLGILLIFSLFLNIGILPLHFEEPRRALVAQEMIISGNYVVPTVNGTYYYNKPPVFNWVLAGLYHLCDADAELLGRVVSIISNLMIAILVFLVARQYIDRRTALFAAFFWLTSAHIYYFNSLLGEIDLFFTLLVFVQVISIFYFFEQKKYWLLYVVSYVFMALGVLTKGLPPILFQAFTLVAIFTYHKEFKKLFSVSHFTAIAIGLLMIFGYFYLYSFYNNPIHFLFNLVSESTDRITVSESFWGSIKHLFLFPFEHYHIVLPWGVFIFLLFKRNVRKDFFENKLLKFSLIFILVNIVPYWLSPGTRDRYLYIFVPFAMIIFAQLADKFYLHSAIRKGIDFVFLVLIIAMAAAFTVIPLLSGFKELANIWAKSIVLSLSFATLAYWFYKKADFRIWILLLVFVVARLAYDVTVLPNKQQSAEMRRPYREIAKEIFELSKGGTVYAYGPLVRQIENVPILGNMEIDLPEVPYFSISFYYSALSKRIMKFTSRKQMGTLCFGEMNHITNEEVEVLRQFYVIELDKTYALFRFKN